MHPSLTCVFSILTWPPFLPHKQTRFNPLRLSGVFGGFSIQGCSQKVPDHNTVTTCRTTTLVQREKSLHMMKGFASLCTQKTSSCLCRFSSVKKYFPPQIFLLIFLFGLDKLVNAKCGFQIKILFIKGKQLYISTLPCIKKQLLLFMWWL